MLSKLNNRLTVVAECMTEFDSLVGQYLTKERCSCVVNLKEVNLEYQHGLTFEDASEQANTLLRLFNIPLGDCGNEDGSINLLVEVSGKDDTTKLRFDFAHNDSHDLFLQYICSQLLLSFQKLEHGLKSEDL